MCGCCCDDNRAQKYDVTASTKASTWLDSSDGVIRVTSIVDVTDVDNHRGLEQTREAVATRFALMISLNIKQSQTVKCTFVKEIS